jgi:hypothetical protein
LQKEDTKGNRVIDMEQFERFCKRYPMLVRRLRDSLRCETPRDVIDWLADNQKVPSRYEEKPSATDFDIGQTALKAPQEQFPLLPPLDPRADDTANPEAMDFDNFMTARDWYTYSVQAVHTGRKPQNMAEKIFLGYPARGQNYVAEYLEKEGWFDEEGWKIKGWLPSDKFQDGREAVAGDGSNWAGRAWHKAYEMYKKHGKEDGLYLEPEEMQSLEERAGKYRKRYDIIPNARGPVVPPEDADNREMVESRNAHETLYWYHFNRTMTNFPHFYFVSQVEQEPQAVKARKDFFMAEQARKAGEREVALERYRRAMPEWRKLLLDHRDFRRDSNVQEDTYEVQLKYLGLMRELVGKDVERLLVEQNYLTQALVRPPIFVPYLPSPYLIRDLELPFVTAFDGEDSQGVPLIQDDAKDRVRNRLNLPPLEPREPPSPSRPVPGNLPPG